MFLCTFCDIDFFVDSSLQVSSLDLLFSHLLVNSRHRFHSMRGVKLQRNLQDKEQKPFVLCFDSN
jgi:hypothetical protein